jgi:hypothetical protein
MAAEYQPTAIGARNAYEARKRLWMILWTRQRS